MSNQSNYQPPTPPNHQPNYGQPNGQNPYQGQYSQPPYGQQGLPYYVPASIQTDAADNRRTSNIAFGISIVMGIIGFALNDGTAFDRQLLPSLFLTIAGIAWITACCYSSKSKGYSGWVGLVAIFGLLGLLILVLLPNRNKVKY